MKVVIDIDKRIYEHAKLREIEGSSSVYSQIIANGTPLPEGHGDLIDRDYFTDKYAGCGNVYCEAISCEDCNSRIVNKFDVDSAPTIILADKNTDKR